MFDLSFQGHSDEKGQRRNLEMTIFRMLQEDNAVLCPVCGNVILERSDGPDRYECEVCKSVFSIHQEGSL